MVSMPSSGTDIRLLSGVPFSNDYKHTRWFRNEDEQFNYFDSRNVIHNIQKSTFQRTDATTILKVGVSVDKLYGTNYVMFRNTGHNNRWFYGFVTKVEFERVEVTHVHVQLDVMQTWRFRINFQPSYIVREHCKLYDSNNNPIVNTQDEKLDYGSEYDVVSVDNYRPQDDLMFLVIVSKSVMHGSPSGGAKDVNKIKPSFKGAPQPLSYYIHPFKRDGTVPDVKISGKSWGLSDILTTMEGIYTQKNAVNNVVTSYITDFIGLDLSYDGKTLELTTTVFNEAMISDNDSLNVQTLYASKMTSFGTLTSDRGNKFGGFITPKESKLLMYPYCVTMLTDFKGNTVELKNEYIKGTQLIIKTRGGLGANNRVVYNAQGYNAGALLTAGNNQIESLNNSLISDSNNDVPIISDYLSAYMQGNKNSIDTQRNSIVFNGSMNALSGAVSTAGGFSNGASVGGIQSGIGTAQGIGNTVLELQSIQSKIKDISNIPPQISKQGGNTAFEFGNNYRGVYIIKKQIKPEYQETLSSFFNAYGYKVNVIKLPNLTTRKHWNYVQTKGCYITMNMNNDDVQAIQSIFDSGITLWHTNDVGNYALSNEVL